LSLILTPTFLATRVEASNIGISPYWLYTDTVSLTMSRTNGTISWNGIITGSSTCASINASYYLYYEDSPGHEILVDSWTNLSTTSRKLRSSGTYSGNPGKYRLYVSAIITSTSNTTETVTDELVKTFT
jgi:hypothetical protein